MSPTRSPPSSPQADGGAIRELQYITHAASTSSPPRPDFAAVALSLSAPSKKRDSDHISSRAVSGVASPQKKKLNYMPSPRQRSANGPAPMEVDSIVDGHDDVDGNDDDGVDGGVLFSPPTLNIARFEDIDDAPPFAAPPFVTPSPNAAELPSDVEAAASNRQPKTKPNKSKKLVLDNTFLTDIRPLYEPDVDDDMDTEPYSDEIKSFDDAFQKQLYFNFSERRGADKKRRDGFRASRSAEIDLDSDVIMTARRRSVSTPSSSSMVSSSPTKMLVIISIFIRRNVRVKNEYRWIARATGTSSFLLEVGRQIARKTKS